MQVEKPQSYVVVNYLKGGWFGDQPTPMNFPTHQSSVVQKQSSVVHHFPQSWMNKIINFNIHFILFSFMGKEQNHE